MRKFRVKYADSFANWQYTFKEKTVLADSVVFKRGSGILILYRHETKTKTKGIFRKREIEYTDHVKIGLISDVRDYNEIVE